MNVEVAMFDDVLGALRTSVRKKSLSRHVVRIWVYKDVCPVIDLGYKKFRFAFNFVPSNGGVFSVDVVERRNNSDFRATSASNGKERIAWDVPLDQAFSFFYQRVIEVFAAVDRQLGVAVPATAPLLSDRTSGKDSASKNVGILTLPLNTNVGGNLQAYALMQILRELGHKPVLINRRHPPEGFRDDPTALNEEVQGSLFSDSISMVKHSPNRLFIEKNIVPLSRVFTSTSQLARNVNHYEFDALVVGSDQVWRPKYTKSIFSDFFLGFLPDDDNKIRRISYAASFGASQWEYDAERTHNAARLIGRFHAVSVREDSAVGMCREHFGIEAQHVLDPTLLLSPDHYAKLSSQDHSNSNQLMVYVLDGSADKSSVIKALSSKLSIHAYHANGQPFSSANSSSTGVGDKSVERWLAAFRGAAFVVTDSFHGAAFSILFNKPFIAYCNLKRGAARFSSLLKMFGLEDRLIYNSVDFDFERMLQPINWKDVNERLEKLRALSMQFLESALSANGQASDRLSSTSQATVDTTAAVAAAQQSYSHPLNVLCSGCGACVSESQGTLSMTWDEDGFLVPHAQSRDIAINAVKVCPFNPRPEAAVKDEDALGKIFLPDAKHFDSRAGRFESAFIGYSNKFRMTSSSGGIATYVFEKLLERGQVDSLYVVQSDGGSGYRYRVAKNTADISATSKTRYFPVSLEELFSIIEHTEGRLAVSGVACFIKAIRLKQHYHPELREKIPFLVGIVCGGLKSRWYTDFLAQSAGIEGVYTQPDYRVKHPESSAIDYSFSAVDEQSRLHKIRMRSLGDMWGTGLFKAKACDFCTDVLTELADISLGDAWLPTYSADGLGNSVVLTRSQLADDIIRSGMKAGELVIHEVPVAQIVRSQKGSFNHRQDSVKFRMWMAETFQKLPVPVIRARLMKDISVPEALVQIHRDRTRSKSLRYWKKAENAKKFMRRMRPSIKSLAAATAARKNGDSEPSAALSAALLAMAEPDTLLHVETRVARSRLVTRWLVRRAQAQQLDLNVVRRAPLEARALRSPETGSDNR
jgi:coenzyme F420-reducing hydrogenase beta subunit